LAAASASTVDWNLEITKLDGSTFNMTYQDILALPQTTVNAYLTCYGNPILAGDWHGVKLADLLNYTGLDPATNSLDFKAADGYIVSLPISTAMRPDVIVAYDLDGTPFTEVLRLVIPGANGNIWISMITSIKMDTALLDVGISGNPIVGPFEQYQASINTTTTQPTQQQLQAQPTPTPTIAPTVPPTNNTQPPQNNQQVSSSADSGFKLETIFLVLLGISVAAVAAGFTVYRYKKSKS
jgi:DMSO/TMAO reductase YedYZ molybdopterin-dependent catalytic subunit